MGRSSNIGLWSRFARLGAAAQGGILLITAAAVALMWANSGWGASYARIWDHELRLGVGSLALEKPVLLWINDGLMAVFFLLVGLEVKRELVEGTLSSRRLAALPIMAAVGGMVVPIAIYWSINAGGGDARGWAIPAATDIAFALGILALLGSRVPVALKVFLTAVAVVDDVGAIAVIAIFFTESLSLHALAIAGLSVVALAVLSRVGVARAWPYVAVGLVLWLAVLKSGMHATIAGVVLAAFIPTRASSTAGSQSPLHRWEHGLQPWVLFGIMPLFALANAGVVIDAGQGGSLVNAVSLGVVAGLLVGKPVGITLFAWIAVRSGLSDLPPDVSWKRLHAVAWLGGIGFTMSLFIGGLSLDGESLIAAKVGLLFASAVCAVVGTSLLIRTCAPENAGRRNAAHPPGRQSLAVDSP